MTRQDDSVDITPEDPNEPLLTPEEIAVFLAEEEQPPANPRPRRSRDAADLVAEHRIMSTRRLLDMPDPDWFIEGLIPEAGMLVLHGDPGSRKTFIALDWMAHAAHGLDWHGRKITPGAVLYVLGEGVAGLGKRLRALAKGMGIDPYLLKIDWMPQPLNIYKVSEKAIPYWAEFVAIRNYKYVVFDTLHKNTYGMDENSAQDMGTAFANAKAIAPDAQIIFVHHDTKKGGTRGSSSIEGDVDAVISVKSTGTLSSVIKSDKIRDAEAFDNIEIHFDEDDESNSIYIKTVGSPAPSATKRQLIVKAVLAQPGEYTRADVCCAVGDGGSTGDAYASLIADGSLYKETRANPDYGKKNGARKMIDVLFVDTQAVPVEDLP